MCAIFDFNILSTALRPERSEDLFHSTILRVIRRVYNFIGLGRIEDIVFALY